MSSSIMTPAAARYISSAGVDHPHYDLALLLLIESIVNAVRYRATKLAITLTWDIKKNAWNCEILANGTGCADFERMKGFQQSNGEGTSRYGVGLWAKQFAGDPSGALPARRMAKIAGVDESMVVITSATELIWKPYPMHITDPKNPFKTEESSGFYDQGYIRQDRLPKAKTVQDIATQFREMVCVKTDQYILDYLNIVLTINGKLICDSRRDNWQSLETVLNNHPGVTKYPGLRAITGNLTTTANHYRIGSGVAIEHFPNYGKNDASSTMVHMHQEGFQNHQAPVHEVYGLKVHPASQSGCVAIVTFTASSPSELPTPAGTRTSYLPTCEIFKHAREEIRKLKPEGWIVWQRARLPAAAVVPAAEPAPAPAAPSASDSESTDSKKARKPRGPMSEEAKAAMKAKRDATIAAKKAAAAEAVVVVPTVTETDAAKIARLEATIAEQAATIAEQAATIAELGRENAVLRTPKNE